MILIILLLTGCDNSGEKSTETIQNGSDGIIRYSIDQAPDYTISLKKTATVEGSQGNPMLGRVAGLAVSEEGEMFVADGYKLAVYEYDPSGKFVKTIARRGRGPGEISNLTFGLALKMKSGKLYVKDAGQKRINVYYADTYDFSHTVSIISTDQATINEIRMSMAVLHHVINDSTFVMLYADIPKVIEGIEEGDIFERFYKMDASGTIFPEKIFELKAPYPWGAGELAREPLMVISNDNYIYHNWTEEFLIKKYDLNGNFISGFYYPVPNIAATENEMRNIESTSNTPDTWPVTNKLLVDDKNRLWVSTHTEDRESSSWWILDEQGKLISRFDWPKKHQVLEIKDDFLYSLEVDEETGENSIAKYEIEFTER